MTSTKTKNVTITRRDFDLATRQKWSSHTCVLAQVALRVGKHVDVFINRLLIDARADRVMTIFDRHFESPGDERKPELKALRASLPIKVKLS